MGQDGDGGNDMAEAAALTSVDLADALLAVHRASDPEQACRAALLSLTPVHGPAYVLRLAADRPGGTGRAVSFMGADGPVFARLRAAGCPPPQRFDLTAMDFSPSAGSEPHVVSLEAGLGSDADAAWSRVAARELGVQSAVLVALGGSGRDAGVLVLLTDGGWPERIASVTAAHLGASVTNLLRAQDVQRSAEIDPETLVYNARRLESEATRELQRASRYRHNLSLVVVRDGDQAAVPGRPRDIAAALVRTIRRSDAVGRLDAGGFGLILPETGVVGAARVVARLGERAERAHLAVEAGTATFPTDGRSLDELLASATGRLRPIEFVAGDRAVNHNGDDAATTDSP